MLNCCSISTGHVPGDLGVACKKRCGPAFSSTPRTDRDCALLLL